MNKEKNIKVINFITFYKFLITDKVTKKIKNKSEKEKRNMFKGFNQIKEAMEKTATLFKMKSGESKLIRVLVPTKEVNAAYEHVENFGGFWKTIECLGKRECPLCKTGKSASLRAYIPILDKADNKVKIFKASKDVIRFLIALEEEYGDLCNYDLKVVRQGEGLKTQYSFFAKDKSDEDLSKYAEHIPPIENLIEKLTKEEIEELMDGITSVNNNDNGNKDNDEDYPF
jgi:hypothetical protein